MGVVIVLPMATTKGKKKQGPWSLFFFFCRSAEPQKRTSTCIFIWRPIPLCTNPYMSTLSLTSLMALVRVLGRNRLVKDYLPLVQDVTADLVVMGGSPFERKRWGTGAAISMWAKIACCTTLEQETLLHGASAQALSKKALDLWGSVMLGCCCCSQLFFWASRSRWLCVWKQTKGGDPRTMVKNEHWAFWALTFKRRGLVFVSCEEWGSWPWLNHPILPSYLPPCLLCPRTSQLTDWS